MLKTTMTTIVAKTPRGFSFSFSFFSVFFSSTVFFNLLSRKGETPLFRMEKNICNKKVPYEIQNDNIVSSKNKKEGKNVLRV